MAWKVKKEIPMGRAGAISGREVPRRALILSSRKLVYLNQKRIPRLKSRRVPARAFSCP